MTGVCSVSDCGRPGRLLPRGWRCDTHRAPIPTPDPARTAAALMRRDAAAAFPNPCPYGTATTDPLGRDDWPLSKTTHLPIRPKKERAA